MRWFAGAVAGAIVLCGLSLLVPGGARAAAAPIITGQPVISGTPQAGAVLTAEATWTGDPAPAVTWVWLRCPRATGSCSVITRAASASYQLTASDVDSVVRVRIRLVNSQGSVQQRSDPTAVVTAAPTAAPAPAPSPPPAPPAPTATPAPTPTVTAPFDVAVAPVPAAPPAAGAQPQTGSRAPMLAPFPVVRIKGLLTAAGARVTLLRVTAPRGARITVVCRGRHCPVRRLVFAAGTRRLRRFERELRAGTRLELTISKRGYVGKVTVIVIRRNAPPWRVDRCLAPGATRAVRCGAS